MATVFHIYKSVLLLQLLMTMALIAAASGELRSQLLPIKQRLMAPSGRGETGGGEKIDGIFDAARTNNDFVSTAHNSNSSKKRTPISYDHYHGNKGEQQTSPKRQRALEPVTVVDNVDSGSKNVKGSGGFVRSCIGGGCMTVTRKRLSAAKKRLLEALARSVHSLNNALMASFTAVGDFSRLHRKLLSLVQKVAVLRCEEHHRPKGGKSGAQPQHQQQSPTTTLSESEGTSMPSTSSSATHLTPPLAQRMTRMRRSAHTAAVKTEKRHPKKPPPYFDTGLSLDVVCPITQRALETLNNNNNNDDGTPAAPTMAVHSAQIVEFMRFARRHLPPCKRKNSNNKGSVLLKKADATHFETTEQHRSWSILQHMLKVVFVPLKSARIGTLESAFSTESNKRLSDAFQRFAPSMACVVEDFLLLLPAGGGPKATGLPPPEMSVKKKNDDDDSVFFIKKHQHHRQNDADDNKN